MEEDEDAGSRHDLVRIGLLPVPLIGTSEASFAYDASLDSPMVGIDKFFVVLLLRAESVLETSQAHFWDLLITN